MPKKKLTPPIGTSRYIKYWDKIVFLFFLGLLVLFTPSQNSFFVLLQSLSPVSAFQPQPIPVPAPYPVVASGVYPGPEITATGIIIYDLASGVYIYQRNDEELFSPASTTKILTALVALDMWKLDDVLTIKTTEMDGQSMELVPGERMTVENLLYGALIHSANDAAYAFAENYPGGEEAFVAAMNAKAQAIRLTKSTFTNPMGYDHPTHKMSPRDLVLLARVAFTNKVIAKMVAIPQITISDVTHTYFHQLRNVNELLGKIPGVGGIKTGWTEEAGENLVTLVHRDGHDLILVVLHSQNRFLETEQLIRWTFEHVKWESY